MVFFFLIFGDIFTFLLIACMWFHGFRFLTCCIPTRSLWWHLGSIIRSRLTDFDVITMPLDCSGLCACIRKNLMRCTDNINVTWQLQWGHCKPCVASFYCASVQNMCVKTTTLSTRYFLPKFLFVLYVYLFVDPLLALKMPVHGSYTV